MKAQKKAIEDNLIEFPPLVEEKQIKGLQKPVVPPGKRYAERQVIPALAENGSTLPWKKFFYYKARLWVLLKEKFSAAAPWYFVGRLNGKQYRRTTQNNSIGLAVGYVIDTWINPPKAKADKNTTRDLDKIPLPKLFAAWEDICGPSAHSTMIDNLSAARRIIRVVYPKKPESALVFEDLFNSSIGRRYKKARIEAAEAEAVKKHGKGAIQAIKIAKAKATSGAASALKKLKGFFADREGSLLEEYAARGVKLPVEAVRAYRDTRITGARAAADVYVRPDDALIKKTFREIEKFNCDEPLDYCGREYRRGGEVRERVRKRAWSRRKNSDAGIIDARKYHVYILFWLAIGFGLRVKEAASTPKSNIRTVDGNMVVTGIGKNENKLIDIDAYGLEAVEAIAPWLNKDKCEYVLGPSWNYRYMVIPKVLRGLMREWGWETDNLIHQLRAYIGWQIYNKVSPIAAQQFMRHESLETTEKYYAGKFQQRVAHKISLKFR